MQYLFSLASVSAIHESFTAGRLVKAFMLAETTDAQRDFYQNEMGRS